MKVAMGLQWLAGGTYQDIAAFHGVSLTSFWHAKECFLDAVNQCKELDIVFPSLDDYDSLRGLADGFQALSSQDLFSDCVGAIDGMLVALAHVHEKDSTQLIRFYTRKGGFALNLQAVADSK
eukprot:2736872-Rhodomonas_salina.1